MAKPTTDQRVEHSVTSSTLGAGVESLLVGTSLLGLMVLDGGMSVGTLSLLGFFLGFLGVPRLSATAIPALVGTSPLVFLGRLAARGFSFFSTSSRLVLGSLMARGSTSKDRI